MSKQVYFVVSVDVETEKVFIDDDTFVARFGLDEQVWDNELNEWIEDPEMDLYNQALKILNSKPIAKDGN